MYHVSAQGVDERMINVYYYYYNDSPPLSGVALPFRDLRQPMRNITYFALMARKKAYSITYN